MLFSKLWCHITHMYKTYAQRLSLIILCFGLATAEPMQASSSVGVFYTNSGDLDLAKVAFYTCGIGLVVVGACALYNYLHTSNQQLIEDCNVFLDRTKKYQNLHSTGI